MSDSDDDCLIVACKPPSTVTIDLTLDNDWSPPRRRQHRKVVDRSSSIDLDDLDSSSPSPESFRCGGLKADEDRHDSPTPSPEECRLQLRDITTPSVRAVQCEQAAKVLRKPNALPVEVSVTMREEMTKRASANLSLTSMLGCGLESFQLVFAATHVGCMSFFR